MLVVFLGLFCALSGHSAVAHVRLLYPVARNYAFDALGNRFSIGSCGMPRDVNLTTDLQAGSTFNVTWNLGSPHEGGLRVELLDKNYKLIALLAPQGGAKNDWYGDNPAAVMQQVSLPKDINCKNCVIRLLKLGSQPNPQNAAATWYFISCADVNVVNDDIASKCSGRGKWNGKSCDCEAPFVGDVCQFADECVVDADCGGTDGMCVDTGAQSYPKKQCYCSPGWHGVGCAMESSVKTLDFQPENYRNQSAPSANFTMFWRILEDIGEIEIVIVAKAKSWVAVGWRPSEINSSCKAFPNIAPDMVTTLSAEGQSEEKLIDFMDRNTTFFTAPLHPMACNDITYIATRGNLSRFQDTYTRDHATPREDKVFGGKDDLTAAVASEDPVTNIVTALFRKKLVATEQSDQSISEGTMHVIWAIGQEPYKPKSWKKPSDSDAGKPVAKLSSKETAKQFYRKGELNSHAHDAKNRGFWDVNLRSGVSVQDSS